jgi:predicted transposase/invertase (TIGR01784 family)
MTTFFPKEDFVFRKLFGDPNHVDMIISFLKTFVDLPDEEYVEVTITDPNLLPETKDGKSCILDLKIRTKSGKIINVEIQRDNTREMAERIAVYAAKLLAEQLSSGRQYKRVNRVISVLITDFDLLKKTNNYHTWFRLRDPSGKITLTDVLEVHTLELSKIPTAEDGQKVWPWLKFLAAETKEEFTMLQQTYTDLQKPVARLMELSADEIIRHQKDSWDKARWDEESRKREAVAEGEARGEARGKAEGEAIRAAQIAVNMLKKGIPVSTIAELTGLTLAEIDALERA